jgi:DNA-binding NarL/FixJ family response regulator
MTKKRLSDDLAVPLPEGANVERLAPGLALLSFPLLTAQLPEALTVAEQEIALLVYAGSSNDDIARARGVSTKTITNQLDSIYRKLAVGSRVELVLKLRGVTRDPSR